MQELIIIDAVIEYIKQNEPLPVETKLIDSAVRPYPYYIVRYPHRKLKVDIYNHKLLMASPSMWVSPGALSNARTHMAISRTDVDWPAGAQHEKWEFFDPADPESLPNLLKQLQEWNYPHLRGENWSESRRT